MDRTAKAFFVRVQEIRDNKYDLSINRYKEIVYEEEEYEPPIVILSQMKKLEAEIMKDMEELEGMLVLIYNDECVGIQVPTTVVLTIVECDPAVRGNSATARTKAAKLETGLEVQVPEYISQGTKIKVDTRSGEYLSRA